MAEEKAVILTQEGRANLEAELKNLKEVRRADVAQKLKEARAQGDLSENAEYDAAKDEQKDIEKRITDIENMLKNAQIIDDTDIDLSVVSLGLTVKVFDDDFQEEEIYTIVGSTEADPMNGKISNESPIGEALIGHKAGETVEAETPNGVIKVKILEITR
jgi:transcription elongation factor GreA